jgi:ribosomal protein S18 acetylase RimI-like enzyme
MLSQLQFKVRRARLEDLTQISQLEVRVWKDLGASVSELKRRFLQYPQGLKVAVIDHQMAGFCCSALLDRQVRAETLDEHFPSQHTPAGRFCFVYGLTVNPIYRRRGIAKRLVGGELETARQKRCVSVQVIANSFSSAIFEGLGFQLVQPLPGLYRSFPELMPGPVLMERSLVQQSRPNSH